MITEQVKLKSVHYRGGSDWLSSSNPLRTENYTLKPIFPGDSQGKDDWTNDLVIWTVFSWSKYTNNL